MRSPAAAHALSYSRAAAVRPVPSRHELSAPRTRPIYKKIQNIYYQLYHTDVCVFFLKSRRRIIIMYYNIFFVL